jgi:hypothetical protein
MRTSSRWRAGGKTPNFCRMTHAVTRHLRQLFNRLPMLAGFRLRSDCMVTDVSIIGCLDHGPMQRLHVSVMQAVVELAECDPGAIVLMRGRSFARAQH